MGERREARAAAIDASMRRMTESPTIEHYRPELLGEGGEHAVFTVAPNLGDRKTVVKVHRETVLNAIRINTHRGTPLQHLNEQERVIVRKRIDVLRASIRRLKRYFGNAVLQERPTFITVPVTSELLKAIEPSHAQDVVVPPGISEVPALVVVQERAPEEAFGPSSFQVKNFYLERKSPKADRYEAYNRACVDHPEQNECARLLPLFSDDIEIFHAADRDPRLRAALSDFIARTIRFTDETGDMLDFIGQNNIRCYKKDGEWHVVMIDARTTPGYFAKAKESIRALQGGYPITGGETSALLNALNYTRFVNAAAGHLGIPDRLRISSTPIAGMSSMMLATMSSFLSGATPSPSPSPASHARPSSPNETYLI